MQLDQFRAVAKPRNEWQAIDLGVVMARAWYMKLFLIWLAPALSLYIILSFVFSNHAYVAIVVVWWLKPFWDRLILFVASRQLFGQQVDYREVIADFFKIMKIDFFWWLTFRRFSPTRSYDLPVTLLERIKGSERRNRLNLLHRRFGNGSLWLHVVGAHVEGFILLGILGVLAILIPQGIEIHWETLFYKERVSIELLYNGLWVVCMALIAPFYVCSGFALYLQRRVDLEGWDIEIRFRQLAQRRKLLRSKLGVNLILCAALSSFFVFDTSTELHAAEDDSSNINELVAEQETPTRISSPEQQASHADIRAIMEGKDFQDIEHRQGYRFKEVEPEDQSIPEWLISFAEWLAEHGEFFSAIAKFFSTTANIIEFLLWVSFAALILYLLYIFRESLIRLVRMPKPIAIEKREAPKVLFGLDVTGESLPDDVILEAKNAWNNNQQRLALSILLRASIVKLIQVHDCPFMEGNTERECAEIVDQEVGAAVAKYFWMLTREWQNLAYAHRRCEQQQFDNLCVVWEEVFAHA